MPNIISRLHLVVFSIIFAKKAYYIETDDQILIERKFFEKFFGEEFIEENDQIKLEFFESLQPLINPSINNILTNNENDKKYLVNKFVKELEIILRRTRIMLNQQFMGNFN